MNKSKNLSKVILGIDYESRKSVNLISKKISMSKEKISYNLKKYENEKIILGYYLVLNPFILNFFKYKLYIKFRFLDDNVKENLLVYLKKIKEVKFINFILDKFDFIIVLNTKSNYDFYKIYNEFCSEFYDLILKKNFFEVFVEYHFYHPFEHRQRLFKKIQKDKTNVKIDEVQKKLIKEMGLNANITYKDLTKKINRNANSLLYSLKNLEKKEVILGYRPRIDFRKLEKEHFIVQVYFENTNEEKIQKIIEEITKLEYTIYITRGISNFDLEFEIVVENNLELIRQLNHLKIKFSNYITEVNSFLVINTIAINYGLY